MQKNCTITDACILAEAQWQHANSKKSVSKGYILYDSIFMTFLKVKVIKMTAIEHGLEKS